MRARRATTLLLGLGLAGVLGACTADGPGLAGGGDPAPPAPPAAGGAVAGGVGEGPPETPADAAEDAAPDVRGVACGGPAPAPVRAAGPADGPAALVPVVAARGPALGLGAAAAVSLALLGEGAPCGGRVVVARADDPAGRTLAATAAVLRDEPLLVLPGDADGWAPLPAAARTLLARRLDALQVTEVSAFGGPPDWLAAHVTRSVDLAGPSAGAGDPLAGLLALLDAPRGAGVGADAQVTVVLVAADDAAAQADAVAHVPAGVVPLVVDLTGGTGPDLAALRTALATFDPAPQVRWAAGDPRTARRLAAILADATPDATADATAGATAGADLPARWTPPTPRGRSGDVGELWLGDARSPGGALAAAVTAARRGVPAVAVDGADLRAGVARTGRLRALAATLHPDAPVLLAGTAAPDAPWQLATVLTGTPLPGGGFLPLEDRRIVALYGSPGAPTLGILGEQDVDATLARAREFAAGYADAADGRTPVPGLDLIATVASSAPEPTGDFSRRVPIDRLRPFVDRAREEGVAVLLDLQPGRTDFLTQAQEYVALLREPHVHLALDPEWRIGPSERHLQRIGSVDAAEVQAVADWLADLVRAERLPQKVLLLHQFTLAMLPDRDSVVIPPELVGVVHVDGQGPLATKERTYAVMTDGAEEQWAWGWKNFTRIDVPLATPERTLDRTPVPLVVTYQ